MSAETRGYGRKLALGIAGAAVLVVAIRVYLWPVSGPEPPGFAELRAMPSIAEISLCELYPQDTPRTIPAKVRVANDQIARFARLEVLAQRNALAAYVEACKGRIGELKTAWDRGYFHFRGKQDAFAFDAGKIDILAISCGKAPCLYRGWNGFIWRKDHTLGIEARINTRIIWFGTARPFDPVDSMETITRAARLVREGYYDVPTGRPPPK